MTITSISRTAHGPMASGNASRRRMSLHQAGTVGVDPKHQERKPDRLKGIALTRNCFFLQKSVKGYLESIYSNPLLGYRHPPITFDYFPNCTTKSTKTMCQCSVMIALFDQSPLWFLPTGNCIGCTLVFTWCWHNGSWFWPTACHS